MKDFAKALARPFDGYEKLAAKSTRNFEKFWNAEGNCCFDVIDVPGGATGSAPNVGNDPSLRPNQIFAVSLPVSPLSARQQKGVVDVCAQQLLTSFGLRSLAPSEASYKGHYGGGVRERDSVYHQGTVWGWLLGSFALAHFRVYGDRHAAQSFLDPLGRTIYTAGLGTISEIFQGDAPHSPAGAMAQAWSVAELFPCLANPKRQQTPPPSSPKFFERAKAAIPLLLILGFALSTPTGEPAFLAGSEWRDGGK